LIVASVWYINGRSVTLLECRDFAIAAFRHATILAIVEVTQKAAVDLTESTTIVGHLVTIVTLFIIVYNAISALWDTKIAEIILQLARPVRLHRASRGTTITVVIVTVIALLVVRCVLGVPKCVHLP